MRTPNEPEDSFSLPPAAPKPAPQPQPEVWKPTDRPGIQQDQHGRLRTNIPDNPGFVQALQLLKDDPTVICISGELKVGAHIQVQGYSRIYEVTGMLSKESPGCPAKVIVQPVK